MNETDIFFFNSKTTSILQYKIHVLYYNNLRKIYDIRSRDVTNCFMANFYIILEFIVDVLIEHHNYTLAADKTFWYLPFLLQQNLSIWYHVLKNILIISSFMIGMSFSMARSRRSESRSCPHTLRSLVFTSRTSVQQWLVSQVVLQRFSAA